MDKLDKILVTGGAGYIGSHTIIELLETRSYQVVSADNFSNPNTLKDSMERIRAITGKEVVNYNIDLCDLQATRKLFRENGFSGVIHFAAFKSVPESVAEPEKYHRNNIGSLENVLSCLKEFGVSNFIFSSSCSVYGNLEKMPVSEQTPLGEALSPYARTKQLGEEVIRNFAKANPSVRSLSLRYFNPVGAHPSGKTGESNKITTNLVPVICNVASGKLKELVVHGTDYPTPDGSCVRDYVHVSDIASAHVMALEYLASGKGSGNYDVLNLGTGKGVSVIEAVKAFERTTGVKVNYRLGPRRAGDVAVIYSDNKRAFGQLGWKPRYTLEEMMSTAWRWQREIAE